MESTLLSREIECDVSTCGDALASLALAYAYREMCSSVGHIRQGYGCRNGFVVAPFLWI